eukprot:1632978-Rhodomonas_salina.1
MEEGMKGVVAGVIGEVGEMEREMGKLVQYYRKREVLLPLPPTPSAVQAVSAMPYAVCSTDCLSAIAYDVASTGCVRCRVLTQRELGTGGAGVG